VIAVAREVDEMSAIISVLAIVVVVAVAVTIIMVLWRGMGVATGERWLM
jgi:hypothetical protein